MKADFFIDRPVFSTVLSIIIVIVGAMGVEGAFPAARTAC